MLSSTFTSLRLQPVFQTFVIFVLCPLTLQMYLNGPQEMCVLELPSMKS